MTNQDEHEPNWMRDKRLRDEEARMVRVEEDLRSIKASAEATHELLLEERKSRRAAEAALLNHENDDASKFASIDSRLQGIQNQLSQISTSNERIERKVDLGEGRIKKLEDGEAGRTAVQRFLSSTWTHMAAGGGVAALAVALYSLLAG